MNSSISIIESEGVAVEEFVARVLAHAYRATVANNAPNDTRGVLYVTHCFAEELATTNPRFDRLRFVSAATNSS